MAKNKNKEVLNGAPGMVFVGAMVFGVGIGFLTDQLVPGAIIGTGAGFVLMGVMTAMASKK